MNFSHLYLLQFEIQKQAEIEAAITSLKENLSPRDRETVIGTPIVGATLPVKKRKTVKVTGYTRATLGLGLLSFSVRKNILLMSKG